MMPGFVLYAGLHWRKVRLIQTAGKTNLGRVEQNQVDFSKEKWKRAGHTLMNEMTMRRNLSLRMIGRTETLAFKMQIRSPRSVGKARLLGRVKILSMKKEGRRHKSRILTTNMMRMMIGQPEPLFRFWELSL